MRKAKPEVKEVVEVKEAPMQSLPVDGGGSIDIFDDRIEINRPPPPPAPEPQKFMTPRMSEKTRAEMEGGKAAVQRHLDRIKWAREFEANRTKLPSELLSEENERRAQGQSTPFALNPGNHPIGRHTTEGDPYQSPHASKVKTG